MDHEQSTRPSISDGTVLPWILFIVALGPYGYSVVTAIGEFGDPPNTANNIWEHVALFAWLALFAAAAILAALTRRLGAAVFIGIAVVLLTWVGLVIVL